MIRVSRVVRSVRIRLTGLAAWPSTIDDFVDHVRAQKK
jgi:hypothetical protein